MTWWRVPSLRWGTICLCFLSLIGLSAPWLAPYSPREQDRENYFRPPMLPDRDCALPWREIGSSGEGRRPDSGGCRVHLLGTDGLGRDILSRLLYGARWSLLAMMLGGSVVVTVGFVVGATAGFLGGFWDRALMRATELVMALPALYLILAVRHVFPDELPAFGAAIIVIGCLAAAGWCTVSRLIRARVLSLRERDFVTASIALGATRRSILRRHILPNLWPYLLLQLGLSLPYFLLGEATLSFLGLGIPEPEPSWGNMLAAASRSASAMTRYWWTVAAPAAALTGAVLSVNLWTEGLRRLYSPGGATGVGEGSKQRRHRAS